MHSTNHPKPSADMQAAGPSSALWKAKQAQQTAKVMALSSHLPAQRAMEDIWLVRDRLHERSSFFRLWPAQLQQLMCRLARPMHWVQNEVLASQGGKPDDLCFILEGQAAVAVRSAPGSSLLRDVATLKAGDTYGELALLGVERNPAFIVVRSKQLLALAVNAQELAVAMLHQQQQALAAGVPSSASEGQQQHWHDDTPSIEALYKLIGETRGGKPRAALSPGQQVQLKKLQVQQLQSAVADEAATVGTWLSHPHTQLLAGSHSTEGQCAAGSSTPAVCLLQEELSNSCAEAAAPLVNVQPAAAAAAPLKAGTRSSCASSSSGYEDENELVSIADPTKVVHRTDLGTRSSPSTAAGLATSRGTAAASSRASPVLGMAADSADSQRKSTMMYRARHSAILHVAVMKAASSTCGGGGATEGQQLR